MTRSWIDIGGVIQEDGARNWIDVGGVVQETQSTSITGTITATEGADTASFAGSVLVSGTIAATEAADTASFAGSVVVSGTIAATEASDSATFVGEVRPPVRTEDFSGGWRYLGPNAPTREQVRERRRKLLGELPREQQPVVERAIKRAIARAETRSRAAGPGVFGWLLDSQQQEAQRLRATLEAAEIGYREDYMQLLAMEVMARLRRLEQQMLREEEEQIVTLLMEM